MTVNRTANAEQRGAQLLSTAGSVAIDDIVIGNDVLELVSSAMYVDPMTVYREYVQNSADAIDEARRQGVLSPDEAGRVEIAIDSAARSVRIRDNGSGVPWPEFGRKLTALGGSAKRGTSARGFRGVGRLAGLGYTQELIFRSRTADENFVSELRWDCLRLKAALRATPLDSGVAGLIHSIVSIERIDAGEYPERFFEVELKGILRLRSDRLMNPVAVAEYLGQVAPVPFAPEFKFGAEITSALRPLVELGELDIRVEGLVTPVYRPHRDHFIDEKHAIAFESVEIIKIPGIDNEIAAVAWILHHEYEGAIPTGALIKGLRLRSGNVQVGDHSLLEDLYPEPRFNVWSVGEVHVIDRRIVPNGRRDHFEQNAHFHNLTNHLTPTARDIARRCRTSSIKRKWLREFEMHCESIAQKIGIIAQGSLSPADCEALVVSAESTLLQMERIAGMKLLADEKPEELLLRVTDLRAEIAALMSDGVPDASPLARLPPHQRSMYEHMFKLVYECSSNRIAAKALVDRILDRLRADGETG
ncbi:ATP-binding protein [Mesorhizobium sp. L-2-11]|uniref:ATP-binding protein n=1 Tax=Mesorhizobium sp. L-2-11 TaxID=2744521 RepID=UPI001926C842|nr:ATP-binding protein [Mesorhizobium sp. L-2-11]BCH13689.1 hypothetical protein MesoLjLa_05400 [Mesorhizobium sp. L-2-11]